MNNLRSVLRYSARSKFSKCIYTRTLNRGMPGVTRRNAYRLTSTPRRSFATATDDNALERCEQFYRRATGHLNRGESTRAASQLLAASEILDEAEQKRGDGGASTRTRMLRAKILLGLANSNLAMSDVERRDDPRLLRALDMFERAIDELVALASETASDSTAADADEESRTMPLAIARMHFAEALGRAGQRQRAADTCREAVRGLESECGEHSDAVACALNNLAGYLMEVDALEEAERACERAAAIFIEKLGAHSKFARHAVLNRIHVLQKLERDAEADTVRAHYEALVDADARGLSAEPEPIDDISGDELAALDAQWRRLPHKAKLDPPGVSLSDRFARQALRHYLRRANKKLDLDDPDVLSFVERLLATIAEQRVRTDEKRGGGGGQRKADQ